MFEDLFADYFATQDFAMNVGFGEPAADSFSFGIEREMKFGVEREMKESGDSSAAQPSEILSMSYAKID